MNDTDKNDSYISETVGEDVTSVVDNLKNQTTQPNVEVETEQPKKKRKPRKKKEPEAELFDLEDAGSLVAIPFVLWGKPLDPDEHKRLSLVTARWLDKRAGDLAKYSVDIAFAICAIEIVLKRTNILSGLLTPTPQQPEQSTNAE
jgi:hypothetical protein